VNIARRVPAQGKLHFQVHASQQGRVDLYRMSLPRTFGEKSWSFNLLHRVGPHMDLASFWRYRRVLLQQDKRPTDGLFKVRAKAPISQDIHLRRSGSDLLTFQEVIVEEVYKPVLEALSSCHTLMDLGANVGLATLYISSRYPGCRCFCVEPNPETFDVLRKNLAGRDAIAHLGAVWSSATTVTPVCDADHYSMATVACAPGATISALPVQQVIEKSGFTSIDLLKVDVEGAEVELFKGDLSWLSRVRAIAIEFHNGSRAAIRFDEVMRQNGYTVSDHGHTVLAVKV
jgi:FkbM family methyltransferase